MLKDPMNNRAIWFSKSSGFVLIASTVLMLITSGAVSERTFVFSIDNAFAQQNATNVTSGRQVMGEGIQGMSGSGQGGGMEHGGQGMQGMQGMSGSGQGDGMEHGEETPGTISEMCNMGDDMPPHYCEPSYNVMSSVKGIKVHNVSILNDTLLMVTVSELNPISNNTVHDMVIVGGEEI